VFAHKIVTYTDDQPWHYLAGLHLSPAVNIPWELSCVYLSNRATDDGGSKRLWNVGQFLQDYTTKHPRRKFVLAAVRTLNFTFDTHATNHEWLNLCFVFRRLGVQIWARRSYILRFSWFFSVPPRECLHSTLKLVHDRFLQNNFHFIVYLSTFHSTLYSLSYWSSSNKLQIHKIQVPTLKRAIKHSRAIDFTCRM
jgi:hypothetical protein